MYRSWAGLALCRQRLTVVMMKRAKQPAQTSGGGRQLGEAVSNAESCKARPSPGCAPPSCVGPCLGRSEAPRQYRSWGGGRSGNGEASRAPNFLPAMRLKRSSNTGLSRGQRGNGGHTQRQVYWPPGVRNATNAAPAAATAAEGAWSLHEGCAMHSALRQPQ